MAQYTIAQATKLVSLPAGSTIVDTGANVQSNLSWLNANASNISSLGLVGSLNLTAAQIAANANAINKITSSDSIHQVQVSDTAAALAANFDAINSTSAHLGSIAISDGATFSLTAAQYAAGTVAMSKVTNLYASNFTVTGVSDISTVLSVASNELVKHVALANGVTISQDVATFNSEANTLALAKVSNLVDSATVNVTGVARLSDVSSLVANKVVDTISFAPDAKLSQDYNSYVSPTNPLLSSKVGANLASVDLTVTGVTNQAAVQSLVSSTSNPYVDHVILGSGAVFSQDVSSFNDPSNLLLSSKISNFESADFTVTGVADLASALSLAANSKVDHVALNGNPSFTQDYATFSTVANTAALGKISNLAAADFTVTGVVDAAAAQSLVSNTNVDHISLASKISQDYSSFNSSSNPLLSSKVSNLGDIELTVTGVTSQSAVQTLLSYKGGSIVDHISLSTASAFSQSYATFSASGNPLLSSKVSNLKDVDLTVTGVNSASAAATLASAIPPYSYVDHITLASNVSTLTATQYSTKITNTGLTVTGADATNALTLAADSHVKTVSLAGTPELSQDYATFSAAANTTALGKISNLSDAKFTVTNVDTAAHAVALAGNDKVDSITLASTANSFNATDFNTISSKLTDATTALTVTGATAGQVANLFTDKHVAQFNITDTAANIKDYLTDIHNDVSHIGAISVTDGKLDLTPQQYAQMGTDVLGKMAGNPAITVNGVNLSHTMTAIDGLVSGAMVYHGTDLIGTTNSLGQVVDVNTKQVITDMGRFGNDPLVFKGGMDTFTHQQITGEMVSTAGNSVATPITTLIAAGVPASALSSLLGLDPKLGIDLGTFDPFAQMSNIGNPELAHAAQTIFTAQQQLFTITEAVLAAGGQGVAGTPATGMAALVGAITTAASNGGTLLPDGSGHVAVMSTLTAAAVTGVIAPGGVPDALAQAKIDAITHAVGAINSNIQAAYSSLDPSALVAAAGDLSSVAVSAAALSQTTMSGIDVLAAATDTKSLTQSVAAVTAAVKDAVCYVEGTLLQTDKGLVAVEDLQVGDMIQTVSGDYQPVVWIGFETINCRRQNNKEHSYPVRISQHAFGFNMPRRDLYVSPLHSIYVNGVMIPAIHLVNDITVTQSRRETFVTYYHVELPQHNAIYAEGLAAESYLDTTPENRNFFKQNDGERKVFALHPKFAACPETTPVWQHIWDTQGFAPLTQSGPTLEAVKAMLMERAQELVQEDKRLIA